MKFNTKIAIWGTIAFIAFGAFYYFVLRSFQAESKNSKEVVIPFDNEADGDLYVYGSVAAIDPIAATITLRLNFEPLGKLADEYGTPTKKFQLYINNDKGETTYNFTKGKVMNPVDVVLSMDGLASKYPHDKHKAELYLEAYDKDEGMLVDFQCKASIAGYNVKISDGRDKSEKDYALSHINFKVTRSKTVIAFAWFIMVLQLFLAVCALFVTLSAVLGKRKIELAMFSWLAALLFAMVPLRNALPAVPPIGSLNDFLSFFWAEGIVGLSLVIIVVAWLIKKPESKELKAASSNNNVSLEKDVMGIIRESINEEKQPEKVLK